MKKPTTATTSANLIPSNPIRIIKKGSCSKLSAAARGELTYHIGYAETDKTFQLRNSTRFGVWNE